MQCPWAVGDRRDIRDRIVRLHNYIRCVVPNASIRVCRNGSCNRFEQFVESFVCFELPFFSLKKVSLSGNAMTEIKFDFFITR